MPHLFARSLVTQAPVNRDRSQLTTHKAPRLLANNTCIPRTHIYRLGLSASVAQPSGPPLPLSPPVSEGAPRSRHPGEGGLSSLQPKGANQLPYLRGSHGKDLSRKHKRKQTATEFLSFALTGVARRAGCCPAHRTVADSFPGRRTRLGCWPGLRVGGCEGQPRGDPLTLRWSSPSL